MFIPLSKLTFCAYLVHPILLQLYYFSRPNAFHFTHAFQLLNMFFAAVVMSYAVALIFSLAFEIPFLHIDKIIFGGRETNKGEHNMKMNIARSNENDQKRSNGQQFFEATDDIALKNAACQEEHVNKASAEAKKENNTPNNSNLCEKKDEEKHLLPSVNETTNIAS